MIPCLTICVTIPACNTTKNSARLYNIMLVFHVFVLYVLKVWIRDEEQNRGCVSYLPLI
jgi:hypothetical protein